MPRIISDELFDSLMQCVCQQRLLGVMGKLERLRDEAKYVVQHESIPIPFPIEGGVGEYELYIGKGIFRNAPETNGD